MPLLFKGGYGLFSAFEGLTTSWERDEKKIVMGEGCRKKK